jgi:hypothetical protein
MLVTYIACMRLYSIRTEGTHRLGELIADFAYPVTFPMLGSEIVPFPGMLRGGVDSLKQTSEYILHWQLSLLFIYSFYLSPTGTRTDDSDI